jgi:hypothetical protein
MGDWVGVHVRISEVTIHHLARRLFKLHLTNHGL